MGTIGFKSKIRENQEEENNEFQKIHSKNRFLDLNFFVLTNIDKSQRKDFKVVNRDGTIVAKGMQVLNKLF